MREDERNAQLESEEYFIEAMNYFLKGLEYSPGNTALLASMKLVVTRAHWIEWSDSIKSKIKS